MRMNPLIQPTWLILPMRFREIPIVLIIQSTAEDEFMEFSQDQNSFAHYSSMVLENY